jgi:hypothetical protein
MSVDDSYTKALLHFDGADASTTITDESGKTWTPAGTAQIDTAQYKWTSSLLLDGDSDYISTPDHDDFNVGSGDFTIDFWVRFNALPGSLETITFFSQRTATSENFSMALFFNPTLKWYFRYSTDGSSYTNIEGLTTHTPSLNTWYHVACVRNGSNFDIYIDGQKQTTKTISGTIYNSTAVFMIGAATPGAPVAFFNGWIDEFRFSKGIARWTSNFTPQSYPYADASTTEVISLSDSVTGIWAHETTSESITLTDTTANDHLVDSVSDALTIADTTGRNATITSNVSETVTLTDVAENILMVEPTTDVATITDISEPDELIRKRVKFPNLQGKHLSLKFESATDGSFAIYYLRHKMFKTRELTSDQKHPNTQGSHIGLKLSNSGTDAFTLMYVSEKMQLVTT